MCLSVCIWCYNSSIFTRYHWSYDDLVPVLTKWTVWTGRQILVSESHEKVQNDNDRFNNRTNETLQQRNLERPTSLNIAGLMLRSDGVTRQIK